MSTLIVATSTGALEKISQGIEPLPEPSYLLVQHPRGYQLIHWPSRRVEWVCNWSIIKCLVVICLAKQILNRANPTRIIMFDLAMSPLANGIQKVACGAETPIEYRYLHFRPFFKKGKLETFTDACSAGKFRNIFIFILFIVSFSVQGIRYDFASYTKSQTPMLRLIRPYGKPLYMGEVTKICPENFQILYVVGAEETLTPDQKGALSSYLKSIGRRYQLAIKRRPNADLPSFLSTVEHDDAVLEYGIGSFIYPGKVLLTLESTAGFQAKSEMSIFLYRIFYDRESTRYRRCKNYNRGSRFLGLCTAKVEEPESVIEADELIDAALRKIK